MNVGANGGASGGTSLQDLVSASQASQSPAQQLIGKYDNVKQDGKLDRDELVNGGLDSVTAEKLIKMLDKDGDSKLSDKEIEDALANWNKSPAEQAACGCGDDKAADKAQGAGGAAGGNQSGASSFIDLLLKALMEVADKDKDGKVSKKEAKNLGISDAQFKKADVNGDGSLSQQEFGTARVEAPTGAEPVYMSASSVGGGGQMSISTV
jgi:Ca2+-binding EF-hand superfamily protein